MLSYEELEDKIIESGMCTVCGACISACSRYYLQLVDGIPKRPKKKAACKNCGTCFDSCFRNHAEYSGEGIGEFFHIVSAKSNMAKSDISDINRSSINRTDKNTSCQDGGIVTAILRGALEMDHIDGAVLTSGEKLMPIPYVAKSAADFDACAGSRYGISPVLMKLRDAIVEEGLNQVCIVGTPCHIRAVRHLQKIDQELSSAVVLTIGLFCNGNFEYRYIEESMKKMKRDLDEGRNYIKVSNGVLTMVSGNKTAIVPLSDVKDWGPGHCKFCGDYASELADISVGSQGSLEGWSTVVVRTDTGDKIFSELERDGDVIVSGFDDMELQKLKRISEDKRKRMMP